MSGKAKRGSSNTSIIKGKIRAMLEGDPGNREKADLQNAIFPWVFTGTTSPQESLSWEARIKQCCKEDFPLVKEGWVREHLAVKTRHPQVHGS